MKKETVRGTHDYLPGQARLREYVRGVILETYRSHGFSLITTPILESLENLEKSEGGENLSLIFKILQRGDKLKKALETGDESGLCDSGLRYDLTLPLARYYANNVDKLLTPFKSIQIDRAFRAERPQKGRLREFIQCDIDIIGSASVNCEIELIDVTTKALTALDITGFTVYINDRRILKAVLSYCGFAPASHDSVCIELDKIDKIGVDQVCQSLAERGYEQAVVDKLRALFAGGADIQSLKAVCSDGCFDDIERAMSALGHICEHRYDIRFDPTLVRGQGYYTGLIFEIRHTSFPGSIAGGGRYDGMVGKFTGQDTPAVGFSIGFEPITAILSETGYEVPGKQRIALVYDEKDIEKAIPAGDTLRGQYEVALTVRPKKLGKLLERLEADGWYGYCVYEDGLKAVARFDKVNP